MSHPITPFLEATTRLLKEQIDNATEVDSLNYTFPPTSAPGPPMGLNNTQSDGDGGRGAYEFVAFILWYLFLVLCCIVPTCCAYRRRRMLEASYRSNGHNHQVTLEQLQALQYAQAQIAMQNGGAGGGTGNLLFLPASIRQSLAQAATQDLVESDEAKAELTKRLEESLEETTFVVKEEDIVEGGENGGGDFTASMAAAATLTTVEEKEDDNAVDEENPTRDQDEHDKEQPAATTSSTLQDMEALALADVEVTSVLQLPKKNEEGVEYVNADRAVPGVCAICLCGYEAGDSVTWSKQPECQHAFHQECIVPWLAKKNDGEPKCPCCRQVYCHVEPISLTDLMNSRNSNNNNNDDPENPTARESITMRRTSHTATMTPFEFMMAVRSGGSSLFFPHEFQMQTTSNRSNNANDANEENEINDENGTDNATDIELGNAPPSASESSERQEEAR